MDTHLLSIITFIPAFAALILAVFLRGDFFRGLFFLVAFLRFTCVSDAPSPPPRRPVRGWNSKPWRPFSLRTSVAAKGRPKREVKSVSSSVFPVFR